MEDFAYGGVGEYDLFHFCDRVSVSHGKRSGSNELRTRITDCMYAEHRLFLGIDHHLAKACLAFILCHKTAGESHGQTTYFDLDTHFLRLLLRDTHRRYLRISKRRK